MRPRPLAAALAVGISAVALATGGCNDGEGTAADVTSVAPTISAPSSTTATPPATTTTTTSEPTTTTTSTTSTAEQPPSTVEDSAENDTPPEPGSPEDAFEQECEKHPERCG